MIKPYLTYGAHAGTPVSGACVIVTRCVMEREEAKQCTRVGFVYFLPKIKIFQKLFKIFYHIESLDACIEH